jgi:hypothetical protein
MHAMSIASEVHVLTTFYPVLLINIGLVIVDTVHKFLINNQPQGNKTSCAQTSYKNCIIGLAICIDARGKENGIVMIIDR